MNLGEIRVSRRAFTFGGVGAGVAGSLLLEACGQRTPSRQSRTPTPETTSPFLLDTSLINSDNLRQATKEIWAKSRNFDIHTLNSLEPVTDNNPASTISSLLPEDILEPRGIKTFVIGNLVEKNSTIVYFTCDDDIRYGSRFSILPPLYPAYMLLDDGTTMIPNNYGQTWYRPEGVGEDWTPQVSFARGDRVENVFITFPIPEGQLAGHEFVVHFQAQLLQSRVSGKDFDSFTIPRRFMLKVNQTPPQPNFQPGRGPIV